jgi:nitroimidazol reductase NimA-like FMN-containing flavoprotein (pyridoxamine 5'-phosphate oxidase superfamily)
VNFTLHNGDIWFRTTPYSELGTYGRNTEVAFEVDEISQDTRTGTSVVAFGRAEAVDDHDELSGLLVDDNPQPWARGQRHLYIRLRIRDLTGRRIAG